MRIHSRLQPGRYRAITDVAVYLMNGRTEMNYVTYAAGVEFELPETAKQFWYAVADDSETFPGDVGKPRCGMVLNGFARALIKVCEIGEAGAIKYSPNNWMVVPDGLNRYTDAMHRHWLAEATGELTDKEGLLHAGCLAWNALARLELILRNEENQREQK